MRWQNGLSCYVVATALVKYTTFLNLTTLSYVDSNTNDFILSFLHSFNGFEMKPSRREWFADFHLRFRRFHKKNLVIVTELQQLCSKL